VSFNRPNPPSRIPGIDPPRDNEVSLGPAITKKSVRDTLKKHNILKRDVDESLGLDEEETMHSKAVKGKDMKQTNALLIIVVVVGTALIAHSHVVFGEISELRNKVEMLEHLVCDN